LVFTRPFVNTSHGTGIKTIGYSFTNLGDNGVGHGYSYNTCYSKNKLTLGMAKTIPILEGRLPWLELPLAGNC
jgi:hypothetical protein